MFSLQKIKIHCSVCHKRRTTESFDLSYTGIQLDFKQLYYLDEPKKSANLNASDQIKCKNIKIHVYMHSVCEKSK